MATGSRKQLAPLPTATGLYHCRVRAYKRLLIEDALKTTNGNRTHAAKLLGLQRTYLLRLMHNMQVR